MTPPATLGSRAVVAVCLGGALISGCNRNNLTPIVGGQIVVTTGDFDRIDAPLDRMDVAHERYDGIIAAATWDRHYDSDRVALKVETLMRDATELARYGALFVASGTRGLGDVTYHQRRPDDHLVGDPEVVDNVLGFVRRGRPLVATDWAYDLVEAAWPDKIEFLNDDEVLDDAQRGEIDDVLAEIVDRSLARALGYDRVSFDYSNWAVIEDVGRSVNVHLRGDVRYREYAEGELTGVRTLTDVPLLVSFPDEHGRVVYSTFHLDSQSADFVDRMLTWLVGPFDVETPEPVAIQE